MNTINVNFTLLKNDDNSINHDKIEVLALHFNTGYNVGMTGLFDGQLDSFYGADFEEITANYSKAKQ